MSGEASWTERIEDEAVRFTAVESNHATIFKWSFTFACCTVNGPTMPTIDRARKFAAAYVRAIHKVVIPEQSDIE